MFKKITNILTANCEVIKFNEKDFFYPIYKNGRSSINNYAKKNKLVILKNKEIFKLKKITVFLRPPKERFVSGVFTYFYLKNHMIDKNILDQIECGDVIDRHFAPQYIWLLHLYKYFRGTIECKSVKELYKLIPNRDGPWTDNLIPWKTITQKEKNQILSINHKKYVDVDEKIIGKYLNKTVELKNLIHEFKE